MILTAYENIFDGYYINSVENKYQLTFTNFKNGSKLEIYDGYILLYFMPIGSLSAAICGSNTGRKKLICQILCLFNLKNHQDFL